MIGARLAAVLSSGIRYLLLARFNQDIAAPLPASLPVDVGGPLTVVDTGNNISISGGEAVFAGGTTAWADTYLASPVQSRAAGLALLFTAKISTLTNFAQGGWTGALGAVANQAGAYFSGGALVAQVGAGEVTTGFGPVINTPYKCLLVLRAGGGFHLLVQGGMLAAWTRLWVDNAPNGAAVYAVLKSYSRPIKYDDARVFVVPSVAEAYTSRLVSPAAGATTTSTADALIEWTQTYDGTTFEMQLRYQDANNYWMVSGGGGNLFLYQVTAGVATSRGSAGAVLTATTIYRFVIVLEANVYKVYQANTLRMTYTDAGSQGTTQTTVRVKTAGGGVSEIIAWPRFVQLPAGI